MIAMMCSVALTVPLMGQKQLDMRLPAFVPGSSAEVRVTLYVEPHPDNRSLVVEADGENMFTSSQIPLEGGSDRRVHQVRFRSLMPGEYVIRATLRSGAGVRATIANRLVVVDF